MALALCLIAVGCGREIKIEIDEQSSFHTRPIAKPDASVSSLRVSVTVTPTSMKLESPVHPDGLRIEPVKESREHDLVGLYQALLEVKEAHPTLREITIIADDNVPYATVVEVIDASRDLRQGQDFASREALLEAPGQSGADKFLFDAVVFQTQ